MNEEIGMNGVMPSNGSMMLAHLNHRAAQQMSRIHRSESLHLPVAMINSDIPPRELGLYSQLTMVLEQAQVDARAAARAYALNR